jgi:cell division protease FtsH
MALGITQTLPEKDALNLSKSKAKNMIAFLFGGRVAEELIFNDITTGAGNDIERATEIARRMVCEWGMSDLGPLSYEKRESPVFLGMNYGNTSREYSDSKAEEIDGEVFKIVTEGYELAKKILTENKNILENLTAALLEFETIDAHEVEIIFKGAALEEIHKIRQNKIDSNNSNNSADKVELSSEARNLAKGNIGGSDPVGSAGPVTV